MAIFKEPALTYDDVLLVPQKSEILPRDVRLKTQLTKNISINIPLISADMDTVTESRMAIAMAREGGIGIIHKNMSIDSQAVQVEIVKRSESGVISDPITLSEGDLVEKAHDVMDKYGISGIPITRDDGTVAGILTRRDLRFEEDVKKQISEVMTTDVITAPVGTTDAQALEILQKNRIEKLPIVDDDGLLRGLITIKDTQKKLDFPLASKDKYGRLIVGASIGVGDEALERVSVLVEKGLDVAVISTAHGHSKGVLDTVKRVRDQYPDLEIIAGNVVTAEGTQELIDAGATAVKIGVGPGSICTTRVVAGVGMPQLSALKECLKASRDAGVPLIADGGIRYSGDIVKALAIGASTIMAGGLFAGSDEAPGETIYYQGKTYKAYRGMGSEGALNKGSRERYGQKGVKKGKLVPEGVEGQVIYKGDVSQIVFQLVGGIRSGFGYLGAEDVDALQERAVFVPITSASLKESHPHDIFITKEASNYHAD